jgi:hydrogenase expression/formation protein HypE
VKPAQPAVAIAPPDLAASDRMVVRAHGGGGTAMTALLGRHIFPFLPDARLHARGDSAVWAESMARNAVLAMTTDAYVVKPLFFPGGDIGRLAVSGTINDLAVSGALPLALSLALILEEGFPLEELDRIMRSIELTAEEAGVGVVTGDTKVVERATSGAPGCYAITSGIGVVPPGRHLDIRSIRAGDVVIATGPVADHGVAVLAARDGLELGPEIRSDVAPLSGLIAHILDAAPRTRMMRDATRGGIAAVLSEISREATVAVRIEETSVPIRPPTAAALEMLGLDPFVVANEGVIIAVIDPSEAAAAIAAAREHPLGLHATRIGEIHSAASGASATGRVIVRTALGGERVLVPPYGEELPRIC